MSRYPYLQSPYDQGLARVAPEPTRQDRQAGYDIGILETGGYNASSSYQPAAAAPAVPPKPKANPPSPVNPFQEAEKPAYPDAPLSPINGRRKPWWKTKQGLIILGLAGIILIGILCGIGAGVATAKKRQKDAAGTESPEQDNTSPRATTSTRFNNGSQLTPSPVSTPVNTNVLPTTTRSRTTNSVVPGPIAIAPTTTIQPGFGLSPTPSNSPANGPMPAYCYAFPFIPECAPFLDNDDQ